MIALSSNWIVLLPIAISLFIALRLADASSDQVRQSMASVLVRSTVVMMLAWSLLSIGFRFNPLTVVWMIGLAVLSIVLVWKNRRLERSALLITLADCRSANERQAAAKFFFDENLGWLRRKAAILCHEFNLGSDWVATLERRGIARGAFERLALRLGARYGTSRARQAGHTNGVSETALLPLEIEANMERMAGRFVIFAWIILLGPMLFFLFRVVFRTFASMFSYFEVPPTPLWSTIDNIGNAFVFGPGVDALVLIPIVMLILFALVLVIWTFPRVLEFIPLRFLAAPYYRCLGFVALSQAMSHHPSLAVACRDAAEVVPVQYIAARLRAAAIGLEQGHPPAQALRAAKLIGKNESHLFSPDAGFNDAVWGLREFTIWISERMVQRYSMIVQILVVALTLFAALLVGGIAVAVIQALSIFAQSI